MKMRNRMPKGRKIFLFGFIIYLSVCATLLFSYIVINYSTKPACPPGELILSFYDTKDTSIKLWSYISILQISKALPKWNPYAPFNVLQLLSVIFHNYTKLNNYESLSEDCRNYGDSRTSQDFVKLDFKYDPYQVADIIFMQHHKMKQYFIFSDSVMITASVFIEKKLETMKMNNTKVNTLVMIVSKLRNDTNFTNVCREAMKRISGSLEPLFIFIGDEDQSKELMTGTNNERVLIKPKEFNISHELYMATQCRHLILDGTPYSTLFTLFTHSQVYIYNAHRTLNKTTAKFKNWHHYFI